MDNTASASSQEIPWLVLLTSQYPYGLTETFLESEIPVLTRYFRVVVVPLNRPLPVERRSLPDGAHLVDISAAHPYKASQIMKKYGRFVTECLRTEWRENPGKRTYIAANLRTITARLLNILYWAEPLGNALDALPGPKMIYSYWMNTAALVGAVACQQEKARAMVCRAHGFDLFEERHPGNYVPFQKAILKQSWSVYTISQYGTAYLQQRAGRYANRIKYMPLGTTDGGLGPEPAPGSTPVVVSCSNAIPLKRLHLLADALLALNEPVVWHHFGDGPELASIAQKFIGETTVETHFHGRVPNSVVLDFYSRHPVHCCALLSLSEGLPVSLQEAASFGIPLLGTRVGGIPEIVNETTGYLLPENPTVPEVIEGLRYLISPLAAPLRKGARDGWENGFNADQNFTAFGQALLHLMPRNASSG